MTEDQGTFFPAQSWPFTAVRLLCYFNNFHYFNQTHSIFDHVKEWLTLDNASCLAIPKKENKGFFLSPINVFLCWGERSGGTYLKV